MLRAAVHVVYPVMGAQYELPTASTSYVLAASDVAYILINASAQADTSGRFRFVPQVVVVSEAVALAVEKAFTADSFGLADSTTTAVAKGLSDSVTMTETFVATLVFIRDFADTVSVAESYAATVAKALIDTASVLDSKALSINKALSQDMVSPQDTPFKAFGRPLLDTVSVADSALISMFFPRTLADSTSVSDTSSLATTKVLADTPVITDTFARSLAKSLTSGVAMNDSFDAGDGAVFVFTKGVSNIVFAVDSRVLFTDKLIGDMIEPVDTGVLIVQNYCDITYFAADYVGVSQIFS